MPSLQRATTLRDINVNATGSGTGVDASSTSRSSYLDARSQAQSHRQRQRQAQYTQSMPPEVFDEEEEDELSGLVIDLDEDVEGVHATIPITDTTTSATVPANTATTTVMGGAAAAPFVHTHLQPPTLAHPTTHHTYIGQAQGQGRRQGRAVSEPPTYAMDLDSDPLYPPSSSAAGDVEMRIHEEEDEGDDSILLATHAASESTSSRAPMSKASPRTASTSKPTLRTSNQSRQAARPLGRWHTDFVIRIRIPGDGKESEGGKNVGEEVNNLEDEGINRHRVALLSEDERMHQQHLAWLSEEEPDIELSQPVYTSYSYPNTSGDEDEIDESQTSNPFLRSPSASPSSPLLAPEPDMAQDQTSTSNTKLVPTLSIPASTIPLAQRSTPTSTQQAAPPSPAPTEIEFPESQDITVDIQRRGVRIRDFAYAPPYVREIRKGNGEREKGTEPNTPAASFYHGGGPSPTNLAYGSISASASFSPSTLPSSSPSPLVYPIYRTPEIFDQYKAMTEVDYRWTQSIRTFPIAGKSLRRLLDMGWLTEQEVRASASDADLEELRVFDERRKQAWENRMDEKDEMKHEEMEVDNIERFGREMEVFPWRWIRKGKWVKLAGGIERDDEDDDEVEDEAPLPPLPFPPINSSTTSSTAASMLKPLPALPLPPIPPPKPLLFPPPPPPFEPGTIPPLSTSSLADLIAYDPPPTLITSLPPFPPAPRAELRAVWVDIKRGYWRQVDRMWVVSREREMRRRREMEEAGKKVREIDERERARKLGMVGKRECSPGKRKVEGEEDDMDIQEDSGGAGTGHEQGQGGVKRRRLSPLVDENVPPSSSKTVVTPVSVVSSQRGARPSTSSVSRSGNPHLQVHPARVVSSSSSNHYPAQSSPAAFSSNLKPPYPSSSTPYSSSYSSTNLIPPEKQYPAPAAAYNPRLYPDARSAKRAQAGVIGMSDSGMKGKAKEKEGAPLERQDTPILDDEAFQSQGSQAQGPSSSPSPRQKGQSQVQTQGEVRVSSAHQGQRLVHPKKTLGGLSRQKSFNELLA